MKFQLYLLPVSLFLFCIVGVCEAFGQAQLNAPLSGQELSGNDHTGTLGPHAAALNLLPERHRKELVVLSESLKSIVSEDAPFCSGRLATLLQRCTFDTLDTDSQDEAAVILTLCDRSRDYVAPMECDALVAAATFTDKLAVKRCATALDQHQNFQRAFDMFRLLIIPEKCKSLNTIFNVDPLKAVYHNVTLNLMAYLQSFTSNELRGTEMFAKWESYLKDLKDSTTSLDLTKETLVSFNEQVAVNLSEMIDAFSGSFIGLRERAQRDNEALSSEFKNQLYIVKEEHEASLASTVSTLAASFSSGLDKLLHGAAERQQSFDAAAALVAHQIGSVLNDLTLARQEFEMLSMFIKESTSKTYNLALLLDTKQIEVSESLMGLANEIRFLTETTRELNTSMGDMSAINYERGTESWFRVSWPLSLILERLDVSSYLAIAFVGFVLPRFILESILRMIFWLMYASASLLMKILFSRRRQFKYQDAEKNCHSLS